MKNTIEQTAHHYIKIVRDQFIEKLWNKREFEKANQIFTSSFVTDTVGYDAESDWKAAHGTGPESMIHHIQWWLLVMPDLQFKITHIAASKNEVMYAWELKGVMKGVFYGIPPTCRKLIIHGSTISFFDEGKISMNKTFIDRYGILQQTNLLPSLPEFLIAAQQNQ